MILPFRNLTTSDPPAAVHVYQVSPRAHNDVDHPYRAVSCAHNPRPCLTADRSLHRGTLPGSQSPFAGSAAARTGVLAVNVVDARVGSRRSFDGGRAGTWALCLCRAHGMFRVA